MSYKGPGKKFMDVVTYTGTNVARNIGGLEFSPDFVWIKSRSATDSHYLFDAVRGAGEGLFTNSSAAETTYTNLLTSFNDDGFGLGDGNDTNTNNDTYVAWCWNSGDETQTIAGGAYNPNDWNDSQVWSTNGVASGGFAAGFGPEGAFDGRIDHDARSNNSQSYVEFTGLNITGATLIEIYHFSGSGYAQGVLINGGGVGSVSPNVWTTVYSGGAITFDSIRCTGPSSGEGRLAAVRVNGQLLVDSGAGFPSIPSTVRANPEAGFSVVKYVGDGGNTAASVGHGLGSEPKFMMVKNLDSATNWEVYHHTQPGNLLYLNTSDAVQASSAFDGATEDTFNVADTVINATGDNIVAYVWTEVPGFSKFGDYPGNSSTTFVYTGFTPRWIMVKGTENGTNWRIHDTKRGINQRLEADNASIESDEGSVFSALSNGFTVSGTSGGYNASGTQYIYMAFAEQPFGKAQKKQLTFASSQDFKEILNQDVLTQYPTADAYGTVDTKDTTNNTIDVYLDGLGADFTPNASQTTTKPVTRPSSKRWTWCAWVKRSAVDTGEIQNLYNCDLGDNRIGQIYFNIDGRFRIYLSSSMDIMTTEAFNDTSTWMHILISYDTVSGDGIKLYINGEIVTEFDIYNQPALGVEFPINITDFPMEIGVDAANPSTTHFSGYMADLQFVDGQALLPSEFLTNITSREDQLYPKKFGEWYGTRGYRLPMYIRDGEFDEPLANTGVADGDTWASTASLPVASWGVSGTSSDFAFDGNPSTSLQLNGSVAGAGGQVFWNPPAGIISGGSVVRIESTSYSSGSGPRFGITLDDNSSIVQNANIALFFEFTVPAGRYIKTVSIQAAVVSPYNVDLLKIIVDGVELTGSYQYEALVFANGTDMSALEPGVTVLQGDEIKNVIFSDDLSSTAGFTIDKPKTQAFNGDSNNFADTNSGGVLNWDTSQYPLTGGLTIEAYCGNIYGYTADGSSTLLGQGEVYVDTVDLGEVSNITRLELDVTVNGTAGLRAVYVNGQQFIDGQPIRMGSTGTVSSVTDTTVALQTSTGTWVNGENVIASNPSYITDLHDKNRLIWEKTNIDATDWGVDTPNNYGDDSGLGAEMRGNYATLNPYDLIGAGAYLTNGNLEFIGSNNYGVVRSTLPISSKTYWETTVPASRTYHLVGMVPYDVELVSDGGSRIGFSSIYGKSASVYPANYNMWYNASTSVAFANDISPGDIIGHAYDPATGEYNAYHNGTLLGTLMLDSGQQYHPAVMDAEPSNFNLINFGSTEFVYPAPVGYKTLNTSNSEDGVIVQGNTQMDVVTYTGTGAEQTISGLNFSPDLVWIKAMHVGTPPVMYDTVRSAGNRLSSSDTTAESYDANSLTGFTSDGFTLGTDLLNGYTNYDGYGEYVAWCWNAGDSTVLNTAGSIATQVRANPLSGFSIVSYTGNGVGGVNAIGHGLGVTPSVIMIKNRDSSSENWIVYNSDLGPDDFLFLNTESPVTASTPPTYLDGTYPNASAISLAGNTATNGSGSRYVAYCWAEVPGFSKFGTVGSSADERFVTTGFKPRYVMFKHTTDSTDWYIFDTERNPNNPMKLALNANDASLQAAVNPADDVQFFDNGFKLWNAGGYNSDYMYMAFADMPTQYYPQ